MSSILRLTEKELPSTCYVFKHSTTCPVSARAAREIEASRTDLPIYRIDVIEQRDLSNWVAQRYGITHESPQLILLNDGKVRKVWNHFEVRREVVS
jgi:bacillithiol system protein YtxJ